jgi:hypothetical protein
MFLLVCVKKTLSVSQVSSSSFWFVWRTRVCSSSLVIFRLVCAKETRLFLKSRHLPSGLTKPVCFSNLDIFLLICVRKTCLSLESRPLPSGLCEENGLCFSITVWSFLLEFRLEKSDLFRCYGFFFFFFFFLVQLLEGCERVYRVLKGFWQSWLFLNYWTILTACNNRSREVVPEEGSGLLGSTSSSSNQNWSILG